MTKIDIISGFLGAGKTTLIQKLLSEALQQEKIVLIENEFGEIGIDSGFLKEAGITVTEMNSGCICCSLVGDFGQALTQVITQYAPDRILIEPSGVGKLSDVIEAVKQVATQMHVQMGSFVTVADVSKVQMYLRNFGEFYANQISHASAIFLTRTEGVAPEKLEATTQYLHTYNPDARIITTPWKELTGAQLLSAMEDSHPLAQTLLQALQQDACCKEHHHHHGEHCDCGEHHHHHDEHCDCGEHHHHHDEHCDCGCHTHGHHADEVFSSWGVETPHTYSEQELQNMLEELDSSRFGIVLRAKGIVPCTQGGWLHFDFVPEEISIRHGAADYTGRICVIGSSLEKEKLTTLFGLE